MNQLVALVLVPMVLYVLPMLIVFSYALYIICAIDYPAETIVDGEERKPCCTEVRQHNADYLAMIMTPKMMPKKTRQSKLDSQC